MLVTPDERVLLLAERWLKLLSDLGLPQCPPPLFSIL